jgi:hypothetical protein
VPYLWQSECPGAMAPYVPDSDSKEEAGMISERRTGSEDPEVERTDVSEEEKESRRTKNKRSR